MNKKLVKVSSAKHVFTSLNIKLFDWSQSVVSHVLKIIFEVFFPKVYIILVVRWLDGSPEGMQFGGLAARQSSFVRNGKSDGSDERQLYSQATKLTKKYC